MKNISYHFVQWDPPAVVTLGADVSPTLPCGKPSRKCQRSGNFWRGEAALWDIMYISWHMVGAQSTERNSFIRAPENSRYHMTGFLSKAERKAIHPINTERIGFGLTRSTMSVRADSTQSCEGLKVTLTYSLKVLISSPFLCYVPAFL